MSKSVRISLANKCQLLFGAAVVLILTAALSVGFIRMQTLVREGQYEAARQLANAWVMGLAQSDPAEDRPATGLHVSPQDQRLRMVHVYKDQFLRLAKNDPFLAEAIAYFKTHLDQNELFRPAQSPDGQSYYRFAKAVRAAPPPNQDDGADTPAATDAHTDFLETILLIQVRADQTQRQLMLNRIYIIAAGLLAGLLAIATFWFITTRIILSPVRVLRDTASKVSEGDLNIRSDINTGDEFEQLSDMFNTMLQNLKHNQDKLYSINKSLDMKLGELAETNVSLYEANVIKGKFLANVSHELRTPLNSIIGFAEVLVESLQKQDKPIDEKRKRYIDNIIISSKQLLELINDLLDLAKIEAGRIELRVSPISVADTAEGLVNLMRPQAEKRDIQLKLKVASDIPIVHTDAGKVQQILFNFLSNAVKFTPPGGTVTLTAGLRKNAVPQRPDAGDAPAPSLCMSVSDTGPGIPMDKQEVIFDKFTQLDSTETREHGGTGLGLAISRELAGFLKGKVELVSDSGCGATFSLVLPLMLEPQSVSLIPTGKRGGDQK